MDTAQAIMDAAERRIRSAGYSGFSFREIADEIGIKSASVHYHFPTKEALAAAVTRRYNDRIAASIDAQIAAGTAPVEAWRHVFRAALADGARMCLCGALGVTSGDLSEEVAAEVRRFFTYGVDKLKAGGLSEARAMQVLATLEGAILIASVRSDPAFFDLSTSDL
ncbi:TetR/AcrR family transcriptional regulator [Methylobacterium nodulans]|uniref:Transcriptional regulator, TetR family n=1 Tax=Methylobacterium nodulans (strain LMG 21967 / CNCM I-2342 / ORS 2060) TaxID=460265 RepID=B8IXP6_METNO|nr:TetR/AcrR family transcriptional regulator [Methylobacterium nodulans]ACL62878.1 transcriptional regulator, TetR family [Methylobacterium nodulans ORS 2060]